VINPIDTPTLKVPVRILLKTRWLSSGNVSQIFLILKFFSDQTIDNIEKNYLSKINVIKESAEEFEITDFGNKLKSELSLDKGILKRVKNLSNNENDLDNLFNEIRNN